MKTVLALDGYSLMYRAHYALADMTTRAGEPTGALHGFFMLLLKLLERKPDYAIVAFDTHAPTFRHGWYADYKAGRKPMPEELRHQMPILKELLCSMGIKTFEKAGYEADDILGTVAAIAKNSGARALLVTGDRDSFQLISDTTNVLLTKAGRSEPILYDADRLMEQYSLTPNRMTDLKALMGDSSDNIPGVGGVGEKTAQKLLLDYGSLEGVYQNIDSIKGKLKERLIADKDKAFLSLRLGTIDTAVDMDMGIEDCALDYSLLGRAKNRLMELELRSVASRLPDYQQQGESKALPNEGKIIAITNEEELQAAAEQVLGAEELAILLNPLSFARDNSTCYVIKNGDSLFDSVLGANELARALLPTLQKAKILTYNGKELMHLCANVDIDFDAMLCDYLLHANRPAKDMASIFIDEFGTAEAVASSLFALRAAMFAKMKDRGVDGLYRDMELPLMRVLFDMECTGVNIDKQVLSAIHREFSDKLTELSGQIYELAGERFNILSTKQLGTILFDKLKLPPQKKLKSGYSTDADVLEALKDRHPIVPLVMSYRFYSKLDSTFVDGLSKCIASDGRIHTHFAQTVTATGRLSSQDPNLQNIPVRTGEGREIRKAFVPSDGNVLVGADYSQIELRLMAHMSGDEGMIESFKTGEDIHRRTASEVFSVPFDQVSSAQRSAAKAVNFGIIYGISDFGLATNLNIPVKQAGRYIAYYLKRYPAVQTFMNSSIDIAKRTGEARTIFNRVRPIPELKQANFNIRSFGERIAMNMPIQGSAADIMKLAMISVHQAIKNEGLKAKLVLQVHDELIVDTPADEADRVTELLAQCMEQVVSLKVPLLAEAKRGINWFETK